MPGELALLSPTTRSDVVELSGTLFRKKVLPKGTINYKGRRITFDDKYLADLASSFKANAYDAVPFVLAKDDNAHTMDPERIRGEVKGFELTNDGLDMLFDLSPDAAKIVREFPKLGVSARIIEGLDRADGKQFPRAIQHVLGTLDPRVTGMGAWQEVALAEEVKDTIDLTKEEVTTLSDVTTDTGGGGGTSPPQTETTRSDTTVVETGTLSAAPGHTVNVHVNSPAGTSRDPSILPGFDDGGEEEEEEDFDFDDVTDEELATAGASLSTPTTEAVELNNPLTERVNKLEMQLAQERFLNEARQYIEAGVPPAIVNLAGKVLSLPHAPVIDLSNDQQVDVGQLLRDVLEEAKGFIELSNEQGSIETPDGAESREEELLAKWRGGK